MIQHNIVLKAKLQAIAARHEEVIPCLDGGPPPKRTNFIDGFNKPSRPASRVEATHAHVRLVCQNMFPGCCKGDLSTGTFTNETRYGISNSK